MARISLSVLMLLNSTQTNMKKVIHIIALLIGVTTMAQTITVNGTPMLVSDDISFPFWLESGSSISPEVPVSSISVLEFNIVPNNNGNDMVFNQVISVTEGQTVPEGKTWKVESILMENQGFESEGSNSFEDSYFIPSSSSAINLKIYEPMVSGHGSTISASVLPSGGSSISEIGFCYSYSNSQPTIYDNITSIGDDSITFQYTYPHSLDDSIMYIRAYATSFEGLAYTEVKQIVRPQLYLGKEYQGGIIFYLDETGEHGLIAAMEDLGNFPYGTCSFSGPYEEAIGTGYQNSLEIVSACPQTIAASEALAYESNGYEDWYLPSFDELSEMYNVIGRGSLFGNIGGFEDYWYWSSSWNGNTAHNVNFGDGSVNYEVYQGVAFPIRAIRIF